MWVDWLAYNLIRLNDRRQYRAIHLYQTRNLIWIDEKAEAAPHSRLSFD